MQMLTTSLVESGDYRLAKPNRSTAQATPCTRTCPSPPAESVSSTDRREECIFRLWLWVGSRPLSQNLPGPLALISLFFFLFSSISNFLLHFIMFWRT